MLIRNPATNPALAMTGNCPLHNQTLRVVAPSIFAKVAHQGVSERYAFVPTIDIVEGLRGAGWAPVFAAEQRVNYASRWGFQKHFLRFARVDDLKRRMEDRPELVMTNSHDRSCAYRLGAGVYRMVCSNGMIVAETSFASIRILHKDFEPSRLIDASLNVAKEMPRISELIEDYKARQLSPVERETFAQGAILSRYESLDLSPVNTTTALAARRAGDEAPSLWNTLNVLQENMVRGGQGDGRYHPQTFRSLGNVRRITGLDENVRINKTLWQMADTLFQGGDLLAVVSKKRKEAVEIDAAAALLN